MIYDAITIALFLGLIALFPVSFVYSCFSKKDSWMDAYIGMTIPFIICNYAVLIVYVIREF